jgi:hypothetical protein
MRKVSEYQQRAAECRQMAASMRDPMHRQQLEDMADAWIILARERSRQLAKQQRPGVLGAPLSDGQGPSQSFIRPPQTIGGGEKTAGE